MYWLWDCRARFFSTVRPRSKPGLGPGTLFELSTYNVRPSALAVTEVGYQAVGMSPSVLPFLRLTTATAFSPPSVTYNVLSSGDSASASGLAPKRSGERGSRLVGAAT